MKRTIKPAPTPEQLAALQAFAKTNGRTWKSTLNNYWQNGADVRMPNGNLLRQVRNEFGPAWLAKFKLEQQS